MQLRKALFTPFHDELRYLKYKLKQKTLDGLTYDIQNAKKPLSVSQVDTIIRTRMIELNPKGNPWSTLKHAFGEEMEDKIFQAVERKNEQLELQQAKTSISQQTEQQNHQLKRIKEGDCENTALSTFHHTKTNKILTIPIFLMYI